MYTVDEQAEISEEIGQQQITILYNNIPITVTAMLLGAIALMIVLLTVVEVPFDGKIILWLASIFASLSLYYWIFRRYSIFKKDINNWKYWGKIFTFVCTFTGFTWIAAFFLFEKNVEQTLWIVMISFSIACILVFYTSSYQKSPQFFIYAILCPYILWAINYCLQNFNQRNNLSDYWSFFTLSFLDYRRNFYHLFD